MGGGGPVTPSYMLDNVRNECECTSIRLDTTKKNKKNRHKKQWSVSGKIIDDDIHNANCPSNRSNPRAGSSVGTNSSMGSNRTAPTLFTSCIGSSDTPRSSKSDELNQIDDTAVNRVSRSQSECSTDPSLNGAALAHSGNSSPSQRSQNTSSSITAANGLPSPKVSTASTHSGLGDMPQQQLLLTPEEIVAEGPLMKKTLLRNGNKPAVSRWQPYWAVLYAPGSLVLYPPRSRFFSRVTHQSPNLQHQNSAVSNCSATSANLIPTSSVNTSTISCEDSSLNVSSLKDQSLQSPPTASSSTFFYSGGLNKWMQFSSNFELSRAPTKTINLNGWMALACTKPRKPDLFLLQEPSRGTIYKMRAGSQAAALEWSQRLREAIRKSSAINLITFE